MTTCEDLKKEILFPDKKDNVQIIQSFTTSKINPFRFSVKILTLLYIFKHFFLNKFLILIE